MKVLFITNLPSPYRVRFFNELGKYCDLTVLYQRKTSAERNPNWNEKIESNYKSIIMRGIPVGVDKAFNFEVINYLSGDYDIIVICGIASPTEILAIEWCRIHNKPYCIESDGGFIKSGLGAREHLKKHLISGAALCFSTGKEHDKYYLFYGTEERNLIRYPFSSVGQEDVLSKPIDIQEKNRIRSKLGLRGEKIVLAVGQFIYRKGFDLLIQAARGLNAQVYIVGGEPTEEYLNMNSHNVHFVGFKKKEELKDYYLAADVFAHPTREDIWGLVVNEAMSYGLPVVTTDRCIAGLEMIEQRKNGIIIPAETVDELRISIEEMLNKDCAVCCLETARKYTIEAMAKAHMEAFEKFETK